MQDQLSATMLATLAWQKLKKVDPTNELLKWMDSEDISDEDFIKKFWDKEDPPENFAGSMVSMRVETNYYLTVKKELKEKFEIEI
ncbi:hypothetical protein KKA39_00970 [Patescibacteria group bacterium]|nr:hypothetical protein [Patescibacteria group bacterium]